eukprot:TRINITY_DN7950_c0_g1_i2.p1 TRINITY_DN7950_c0_g1~~TRINITY_DN7950_c0_g1_i2.p1  ORF type:complete len:190 (-),score=24.62 TRINITY_DN7950_c0_g1_i2:49-618(-)
MNKFFFSALVLCEYMWRNKSIYKDITTIELGSGTGICSVMASKSGAKKVIATDHKDDLILNNIKNNLSLNKTGKNKVIDLEWGTFSNYWVSFVKKAKLKPKKTVLIGSDCFYDSSLYENLLCTVYFLLSKGNIDKFVTSYQVRSEKSISFLLQRWGLSAKVIPLNSFLSEEEIENMEYEILLIEIKLEK